MNPVREALYARLSGDGDLGNLLSQPGAIFHRTAPQGTPPPYVIFHKQAGSRQWAMQGEPTRPQMWLVKGVCRGGSAADAEAIDERCEELLNDAALLVDDHDLLLKPMRESDVDYGEIDGGEQAHHVGGLYRLVTERA